MLTDQSLAVEAAYVEFHGPLERRLGRIVHDRVEAEDLASEAFLRLSRAVASGRSPERPNAWLTRVGVNLARSRCRHLAAADRLAPNLRPPAAPPQPESSAVNDELLRAAYRVLALLSPAERRVVILATTGRPIAQIAASMGRTAGAVRTCLCRARAKVRARLSEEGYLIEPPASRRAAPPDPGRPRLPAAAAP